MEEEMYQMIYKKSQIKRKNLESEIQILYENLKISDVEKSDLTKFIDEGITDFLTEIAENTENIQILGIEFVQNNANKGKLIINNKKSRLKPFLEIKNMKEDKVKIKMILNKNTHNKSYMFKNCTTLIKFSL
jgi:hypothetical protein